MENVWFSCQKILSPLFLVVWCSSLSSIGPGPLERAVRQLRQVRLRQVHGSQAAECQHEGHLGRRRLERGLGQVLHGKGKPLC